MMVSAWIEITAEQVKSESVYFKNAAGLVKGLDAESKKRG
jgi:hypothetical protein